MGIVNIIEWVIERLPISKPEERRRNEIDKLEDRQRFIERNFRNDLASEYTNNSVKLRKLYEEAKNRN